MKLENVEPYINRTYMLICYIGYTNFSMDKGIHSIYQPTSYTMCFVLPLIIAILQLMPSTLNILNQLGSSNAGPSCLKLKVNNNGMFSSTYFVLLYYVWYGMV